MSRITLVPTFRAGQTPHRLPLSSRDNLALRYDARSVDEHYDEIIQQLDANAAKNAEHAGFFDADGVKPADASDGVGLWLGRLSHALCLIAFGAIAFGVVYLLEVKW